MSVVKRGTDRFNRFRKEHVKHFGRQPAGRLLDFGCGAGGFVLAALKAGLQVDGVEVAADREVQFRANAAKFNPAANDSLTMYDGSRIPFASGSLDCCYSWFVFEHVVDPQMSLREIVRVLKPGGTLSIFADDVRNCWDGHAMAPWPAYLPREFAGAYAEGLGLADQAEFLSEQVVYISAPVLTDMLRTLGMQVVYLNEGPMLDPVLVAEGVNVTTEAGARALGEKVAASKPWTSPVENLTLFAVKP